MKPNKEQAKSKLMTAFHKHGGGTQVDPEYTTKNPEALLSGLQESFDKIFPELMKPSKYRKHVIFDEDVFQFFEKLSGDNGSKFSSMINSALRSFVRERLISNSKDHDPVAELLSIRERERELLKEIKELDLTKELQQKLG
jgi:hypothetical protein